MKLSNLAANLRKYGLTVVEVGNWSNYGYAGQDLQAVNGVIWHHTATPRSNYERSDAPTLGLCVNGRSDLPGPLCNIVFGRTGIVYLVAAGVANHAGVGGFGATIPQNLGNHYTIGIEMESSGIAPWDWTEDQKRVAPYLGAALELEYLQHQPAELRQQIGHMEYSSEGKIDPAGWPGGMDGMRDQINEKIAELTGGTPAPAAPVPSTPSPVSGPYVPDPHWLVESGETLSQIADWAKVSIPEIAKFNGIKDANVINVGERIWSPRAGADTWTVDPGDTLAGIAAWYGTQGHTVTVEQLKNANGINDPATETKVGMRLLIP